LDKATTLEARLLRKELLAIFEVREFSQEGQFANPSESLKLPQVICDNCALARDLDLCRDEDLMPDLGPDGTPLPTQTRAWKCLWCSHEYNRLAIEEKMIAQLQQVVTAWSTQDLKCAKCKAIKINDFMEHCSCSGEWVCTMDREDVVKKLKVYRSVGEFYGLRMLSDVVGALFDGCRNFASAKGALH
jgi:DNA polymerase epsilon subunit 1